MQGMWCPVIKQTFALIHGGWNSAWGLVLEMCHGQEQPRLIFWTNYPDVLDFVILALGRQQDGALSKPRQPQKLSKSFNPSPEHANVIAF